MVGKTEVPVARNRVELPGGVAIGNFWRYCKRLKRCGRPPYDRLLNNPVLRTDYCMRTVA